MGGRTVDDAGDDVRRADLSGAGWRNRPAMAVVIALGPVLSSPLPVVCIRPCRLSRHLARPEIAAGGHGRQSPLAFSPHFLPACGRCSITSTMVYFDSVSMFSFAAGRRYLEGIARRKAGDAPKAWSAHPGVLSPSGRLASQPGRRAVAALLNVRSGDVLLIKRWRVSRPMARCWKAQLGERIPADRRKPAG